MREIKVSVSLENLTSRIPALFPYYEFGEDGVGNGVCSPVKDGGCYGSIVPDIYLDERDGLVYNGEVILKGDEHYSYSTIINTYHQYKGLLTQDESDFITFVEWYIGKVDIPKSHLGKYPKSPSYYYLSNAFRWRDELVKMKKKCEHYKANPHLYVDDVEICCKCEQFNAIGGSELIDIIGDPTRAIRERTDDFHGFGEREYKEATIRVDIDLLSTHKDMGCVVPYAPQWLPYRVYKEGDIVFYDDTLWVATAEETSVVYDANLCRVVFPKNQFKKVGSNISKFESGRPSKNTTLTVRGKTDGKLRDMRRLETYTSDGQTPEYTDNNEDWLFYYRVGRIMNVRSVNDDLGNICLLSGSTAIDDGGEELALYGDVIESIECDGDDKTITFTYYHGVHLTADYAKQEVDDDGNVKHYWTNFVVDERNDTGVKYVETYYYDEDSELDLLASGKFLAADGTGVDFVKYINGDYDKQLNTYKFAFDLRGNQHSAEIIFNGNVHRYSATTASFESFRTDFNEFVDIPHFRRDYLNGIAFVEPTTVDLDINRGIGSITEKHIRLSEVKTLNDLLSYQNGNFFATQ